MGRRPHSPLSRAPAGAATLVVAGLVAALVVPTARADDEPARGSAPVLRGEVETVPGDSAWQGPWRTQEAAGMRSAMAQRSMLWSGRGAWQLGLGVQQAAAGPYAPGMAPGAGPFQGARLLLGASVDTGSHTQLRWHTPLPTSLVEPADEPRVMEVSLVLKAQDPLANLRRGSLMKLELGGQTQLALRPRGGKIMLRLTSQW